METGLTLVLAAPQPIEENAAAIYLASLVGVSGRKTQGQVIRYIAEWLGGTPETVNWGNLRLANIAFLKTKIAEYQYAPASIKKFYAAIRGILLNANDLGQINAEEYQRAQRKLGKVRGSKLPAGRYIEPQEMAKLFEVCFQDHETVRGTRDAALLAVMYLAGARRAEIAALDLGDYEPETGKIDIRYGKGGKERVSFIGTDGQRIVNTWIEARGTQPGPLFLAVLKTGEVRTGFHRLTPQALYNVIVNRTLEAGLENISPHDFRRSCITDQLDAGTDLVLVSLAVGHSNPQTTARYDRRPEQSLRAAATRLHIPRTEQTG